MFSRSSRGQLPRPSTRSLQPAFDQLHLPWLCPALYEQPRGRQSVRTSTSGVSRKASLGAAHRLSRKLALAQTSTPGRGFASPATLPESIDDYIPFVSSDVFPPSPQPSSETVRGDGGVGGHRRSLSELPPWDPTKTLQVADSMQDGSRKFAYELRASVEIEDIHAVLQAYLHVGQFERAMTTVRRLHGIYTINSPELFGAHLTYIATVVSHIIITRDQALLKHLKRWFNEDVRAKGIKPNGTMIALLVQAGLREHNNKKIGRTIRDYLQAAKKNDALVDAKEEMKSCLSDDEYEKVMNVAPEYFEDVNLVSETQMQEAEQIPEVRPQAQKGYGLIALRQSLSIFSDKDSPPGENQANGPPEVEVSANSRQSRLEHDTTVSALARWRADHAFMLKKTGIHTGVQSKSVGALMWNWQNALVPLISEELEKIKASVTDDFPKQERKENSDRRIYGPFLQYLPVDKLAAVTIISCMQTLVRFERPKWKKGCPVTAVVVGIGKAIEEESVAEIVKARNRQWMSKKMPERERQKKLSGLVRDERRAGPNPLMKEDWSVSGEKEWSTVVRVNVGVALFSMLLKSAMIDVPVKKSGERGKLYESQAAFSRATEFEQGHRIGVVRLNEELAVKLRKEPTGSIIAKHLPMLTPPVPWTGYRAGGFLNQPVEVIRLGMNFRQLKQYVKLAANSGDMEQVFAGLDILGRTPWRINKGVFDVMLEVWNSGEGIGNIPPANPQAEYPPEPANKDSVAARRLHAWQCRQVDNQIDGLHSNRCFQNFQIEVARAFLNETFYFPHNVDFRGRAYPIPPYLNHMGADNCRGLLMFGKGKELGEGGLTWLRVHLANVFGYDKASFTERHQFAIDHMEDVRDSAVNPLHGNRWWLKAEDPWQCLATCIELKNALDSPEPTKFVSHLPIHQDGTCNGLQHYAALGGDAIGAKQVNLEPGERPADIYTAVAEMVQERIAKDVEAGDALAKTLNGKIKRKIVKQTVMTNVYGVTFTGAMLQVKRQLEDFYPDMFKEDPRAIFDASCYISRKIFDSLSAMFNGAHDIQFWLTECASRICQSLTPEQIQSIEDGAEGKTASKRFKAAIMNGARVGDETTRFRSSVIWTTPLKMPVVQPYRKARPQMVRTNLQSLHIAEPSIADPVHKAKQVQAFPPNFIHSLDATHMLLSALKCDELGLSFAAVHDSFWTHAADVDTMNRVLRDAFIKMHSEDITGRLGAEFAARYKGCMSLVKVPRFSVLGQKIFNHRVAGRLSKAPEQKIRIDELLTETKRLRLLASEDQTERAQGSAMITPASLVANAVEGDDAYIGKEGGGDSYKPQKRKTAKLKQVEQALRGATKPPQKTSRKIGSDAGTVVAPADFAPEAVAAARLALNLDGLESHETEEGECAITEADAATELETKRAAAKRLRDAELQRKNVKVWAWVPLTFPEVPRKGSWDVNRLKDSKYFFS